MLCYKKATKCGWLTATEASDGFSGTALYMCWYSLSAFLSGEQHGDLPIYLHIYVIGRFLTCVSFIQAIEG